MADTQRTTETAPTPAPSPRDIRVVLHPLLDRLFRLAALSEVASVAALRYLKSQQVTSMNLGLAASIDAASDARASVLALAAGAAPGWKPPADADGVAAKEVASMLGRPTSELRAEETTAFAHMKAYSDDEQKKDAIGTAAELAKMGATAEIAEPLASIFVSVHRLELNWRALFATIRASLSAARDECDERNAEIIGLIQQVAAEVAARSAV